MTDEEQEREHCERVWQLMRETHSKQAEIGMLFEERAAARAEGEAAQQRARFVELSELEAKHAADVEAALEEIECARCGDEIPCCHMDDVPREERLCDGCTHTALQESSAEVKALREGLAEAFESGRVAGAETYLSGLETERVELEAENAKLREELSLSGRELVLANARLQSRADGEELDLLTLKDEQEERDHCGRIAQELEYELITMRSAGFTNVAARKIVLRERAAAREQGRAEERDFAIAHFNNAEERLKELCKLQSKHERLVAAVRASMNAADAELLAALADEP